VRRLARPLGGGACSAKNKPGGTAMTTMERLDYASATVAELRAALDRREVSARELADTAIGRIEAKDGAINAIVVRDFERARRAADAADRALAAGERAPLLGVPMTVKESFDITGHPTTWGLEPFRSHVAQEDALAVQRLKRAGAVVLGKSNVPVSLADWQSVNPIYGRTNNPHDLGRSAGGSSGGGGAALAAGYVPLELGSDIGGSIRIPAAFNGVFGHKPSHGLLPTRGHSPGGLGGAEPPLAVIGPLARSADDLATAMDVLAGPDEAVQRAGGAPLAPPRHRRAEDFRVLVLDEHPVCRTAREVREAVTRSADRLASAGARVERAAGKTPDLEAAHQTYIRMLTTVITRGDPSAREPISAHAWLDAVDAQTRVRRQWGALFESWDVVLAPVFGRTAFPHIDHPVWAERTLTIDGEETPYGPQLAWPGVAIFAHLPATAFPAGKDAEGLPIGVQAIGPYMEDLTPIRLAALATT
jgi:amidase